MRIVRRIEDTREYVELRDRYASWRRAGFRADETPWEPASGTATPYYCIPALQLNAGHPYSILYRKYARVPDEYDPERWATMALVDIGMGRIVPVLDQQARLDFVEQK